MARTYGIWEWVGILLIVVLVLNIIGFVLRIISTLWFWLVIVVIAYLAYYGLPRWRKR